MRKFSLRWIEAATPGTRELEIGVDGLSFLEQVRRWELEHCPEPELAGEYAAYPHLFREMLGHCVAGQISEIAVLNCTCGDAFCWPLEAQMETTNRHVIWSHFIQPHRSATWFYKEFGPFVFDRAKFISEIGSLFAEEDREIL